MRERNLISIPSQNNIAAELFYSDIGSYLVVDPGFPRGGLIGCKVLCNTALK